jgi:N-glycosylase/DNA lyase
VTLPRLAWADLPHHTFEYPPTLLSLRWTLACGQAFRWRETPGGWWVGVVRGRVLRVRSEGSRVTWVAYPEPLEPDFWHSYLRLDFDLAAMYSQLGALDPHLRASFESWRGLRILRQDPMETISSFLCTTANSIPRIARAIEGMSRAWGEPIATIDGVSYFGFPPPGVFTQELVPALERDCNLGYRAYNLVRAMDQIAAEPPGWADSLRAMPYAEARAELMSVRGIGPKIADCVSLFALDKDEAVPVDTHVRQLALELYLPELTQKSLTTNVYNRIAGRFREMFGSRAGWAQQYLFFSHLMRHRETPVL